MAASAVTVSLWVVGTTCMLAADEPVWIRPPSVAPSGQPTRFAGALELTAKPDTALLRIAAYRRYRLIVNGRGVSVGDTPWDAETYDAAPLLHRGRNEIIAEVADDAAPAPENAWLWLRQQLPQPFRARKLTFETQGAVADEWLYVELLDADGDTTGLFCSERDHPDLMLGRGGQAARHEIRLDTQDRLAWRATGTCDLDHVVAVRIRLDQKRTSQTLAGSVRIAGVILSGPDGELGLSPSAWSVEAGTGEYRRSTVEPLSDGNGLVLHYDFTPAASPALAVDLRAWRDGREIGRLVSGAEWSTDSGRATPGWMPPVEWISWVRTSLTGPDEPTSPRRSACTEVRLRSGDRCHVGDAVAGEVRVWTLVPRSVRTATVRAVSWSGEEEASVACRVHWRGFTGIGRFELPALSRGFHRLSASTDRDDPPDHRYSALAVLAPGEARIRSVFDTLTPVAQCPGLQGIDLEYVDQAALPFEIQDLGANFLQFHLNPKQLDNGEFDELIALCQALGTRFALNNEWCNWTPESKAPDGTDRFVAPGGCHRWDLEEPALRTAAATGLFEGVVYDEGEHMQLCRNAYAALPDTDHRKPYIVETTGMTLLEAYHSFTAATRQLVERNRALGARTIVESVFPALWEPMARAGVTLCPKLLKEDIHPVVLATALGAAKQYGADLWFSPDLWYTDRFPGHSVESYRAALELAYQAGVDHVYSEQIVAMCRVRGEVYDVTGHGRALREFIDRLRERPERPYAYRDYAPEVAIIHFPDSDWGQASCYYWDTLYGAENLPPTAETAEWMQVWSLLTEGASDPRAVNTNSSVYPMGSWRFTMPCMPVAVYDHRVGDGPLEGVKTLFLAGLDLPRPTLEAVGRRVRAGAVCFAPRRQCPEGVAARAAALPMRVPDGRGSWIVVDGFAPEQLGEYLRLVPTTHEGMHLRFGEHAVRIGSVADEP
ncbi:MAG TPA: hypothetical protein PLD23_08765 [Armatimonadota bacterium]|nr:hypothetical protein [Armatimonadota bacterium]